MGVMEVMAGQETACGLSHCPPDLMMDGVVGRVSSIPGPGVGTGWSSPEQHVNN